MTVVPVSCMELDEIEIKRILAGILFEFPVKEVRMEMPRWLTNLEKNHWLRTAVYRSIAQASERVEKSARCRELRKRFPSASISKRRKPFRWIWAPAGRECQFL